MPGRELRKIQKRILERRAGIKLKHIGNTPKTKERGIVIIQTQNNKEQ